MKSTFRIKLKRNGNIVKVKALIKHPMETGLRKSKKNNKLIPAHFIKEVTCTHNDMVVLEAEWGVAISTNPYLSFYVENGNPGDNITIAWKDNLGKTDSISKQVS